MRITKEGKAQPGIPETADMDEINRLAKTELSQDEVYVFSILLCDNEVDRDFERFPEQTLMELGGLFVGITGISDHEWKSAGQIARIYRTELVREPGKRCLDGTPYIYLKGWAYMLRTDATGTLISEIEGGIKKEASIGCSVERSVCSICGQDIGTGSCAHEKGREYAGALCYAELVGASDAYEWSFVAVPAQKMAGVIKRFEPDPRSLKEFVHSTPGSGFLHDFERLEECAALGKRYESLLRGEVLRLSLLHDRDMRSSLEGAVTKMNYLELEALKRSLEMKLAETFPPTAQLPGGGGSATSGGENYGEYGVYRI